MVMLDDHMPLDTQLRSQHLILLGEAFVYQLEVARDLTASCKRKTRIERSSENDTAIRNARNMSSASERI